MSSLSEVVVLRFECRQDIRREPLVIIKEMVLSLSFYLFTIPRV